MTYGECFGTGIGESGKIITADTVLEVAAIDESINGDGGLTLGWNSTTGGGLAVGTAIGKYVLLQPYVPTKNSDGSYRYEVKFSDPIALLGKKLFYKMVTVLDKAGNSTQTPLYTFSFVGKASTIIGALAQAGGVSCDASNMADSGTISVSFDGDSIKSAAEKIGSACDLAVWYTEGCIHFGSSVNFISGEYYNHFVVLGGTKNMTKKIVTSEGEEYAAVTQRLTLDSTQYPGSVIGSGTPEMTKLLVFDNIYPKARLKVTHVYRRECWMLNEAGDKIPTAWQGEGENRVATAWAKYTKWYVRLGDADGEGHIDQSNLERLIVDGTTLRMQFLPFAEGGTSVLAGREFELVHFTGINPVNEKEDDDVDPNGFMAQPGMYRIVMTADCNTLLPSDALPPAVGDLVTLVNIAVPDTCYAKAREELLAAGEAVAAMYGVAVPAPESYTGGGGASIGETSGGYLVTNVHTDLITGEVQVTYGTLAQRGMIASLIDKVDGVQTTGGGGTTGNSDGQGVGTMSSEQWNTLAQAGGRTGLVTINSRIERVANQVQTYGTDLAQVQSQADQKMQLWFGTYAPTAANYPAVEWVTDAEKQLHVEDIFYDYSREAADPDGGKAWRWTRHEETVNGETVVTYSWDEVTDAETLLAIEKASDIASDGKITGGAEKVRLYNEWLRVVDEHTKYNSLHDTYGLNVNYYNSAYAWLARMLNGGEVFTSGTPSWVRSLATTTNILFGSQFIEDIGSAYQDWELDTTDLEAASRKIYRCVWAEYYLQADALDRASKETANAAFQNVTALADDGIISAGTEKSQLLTLWKETVAEFWKLLAQAEDYGLQADVPVGQGLNRYQAYCESYCILAWMLNDDQQGSLSDYIDGDGKFLENLTDIFLGTALPSWIGTDFATDTRLSETEIETAHAYRTAWNGYHSARANLLKRIEEAAKTATDHAQTDATSALGQLTDMANDLKITPDEKRELRKQWTAWATEYDNFRALFTADPVINALSAVSAYKTAFANIGGFLNNPSDIDFPAEGSVQSYAALQPAMIWANATTTLTTAQATQYKQRMTAFLAARTAMLTALSTQNISFFVSATPPAPPFFIGDRWLWLNHLADGRVADGENINTGEYEALTATDTMMVCTQALSELPQGQSGYTVGDYWAEASKVFAEVEPDPRNLLAALADRLYVLYGSQAANFPISVSLDANGSTATPNNGNSDDDGNVASLLSQLQAMIGDTDFGIFIQTPLNAQEYDMLCVPVTCSIPGSNGESITGGIQIKMYNGTEWEYIQESTSSLLESLGNKILAMVFGSNAAATEAAGLTVGQRFAKLFAQATVWDASANNGQGDYVTLSQALFGLSISQDINGHYYSSGLLSADKINFTATNSFTTAVGNAAHGLKMVMATEDANTSTFTLGYYYDNNGTQTLKNVLSFDSSGKLNLTADNTTISSTLFQLISQNISIDASELDIDASTIDFSGKTITLTSDTALTFSGGTIDFSGTNVQMNAANITLSGTPSQSFQNAVAASGVVLKSDMAQFGLYSNGAFVSGVTALLVNSSTGVPTTTLNLRGNNVNIDADCLKIYTTTTDEQTGETITTETAVFSGGKISASIVDFDNATIQNLHVTGNSTFDGQVSGTILPTVDFYHNVRLVTSAGNNQVGNADIVMIGGRFNGASEDVIITLPDPTSCAGKVISIYGAHRPADFDTTGFSIRLAILGTGQSEIKTAWGTTGIPINHSLNSLKYTNEMVIRSNGSEWRLYRWTTMEVTNTGTYVKDALAGVW